MLTTIDVDALGFVSANLQARPQCDRAGLERIDRKTEQEFGTEIDSKVYLTINRLRELKFLSLAVTTRARLVRSADGSYALALGATGTRGGRLEDGVMPVRFDGRVAIVTGAGSGLGRSHALMLASRGAKVVVNDLGGAVDGAGRSSEAADRVVAEIKAGGGEALANYDSVSDEAGAKRLIDNAVSRFGHVDVLVNNPGILRDKTFAKMASEDFRAVVDVHLMGSVYCTAAAWPHMREAGYGRIVMTSRRRALWKFWSIELRRGKDGAGRVGERHELRGAPRTEYCINTVAPIAATRMTEALMPKHALPYLNPNMFRPRCSICAAECQSSGDVISVGAGYFAKTSMMEARGVYLAQDQAVVPIPSRPRMTRLRICLAHGRSLRPRNTSTTCCPILT